MNRHLVALLPFVVAPLALSCQIVPQPPAPARASPESADAIVARWAAAVGGAQRVLRIRAIHRSAESVEDGLKGLREEWLSAAGQRRESIDHGHDQSLTVFDGTRAWLHDWNGKMQELHGADRETQVNLTVLHGFAALTGKAGRAAYLGEDASGKLLKLRFHPDHGSQITYYLDKATCLPVRAELPTFDQILTVTFADFREVDGLRVPFMETHADAVTTTEVRLKKVIFDDPERVSYTRPWEGPSDARFLLSDPAPPVPFNFENNHVMVETQVNGRPPIWFLLDTGANYTVVNDARLAELQLTSYGALKTEGGGNTTSGSYVEGASFRVGDVEVKDQHAAVLPLRGLEKIYGMPMGGLLGYDFISRFVIEIDYPSKTLTFHDPARYAYRGKGAVVPFVLEGNEPYLAESIAVKDRTIEARFILDVGAADTITLTTPFVQQHHLVEIAGSPDNQVRKLAGSEKEFFAPTTTRGLLDQVKIGPFTLRHVPVNLSLGDKGAYASASFSGNIGETIFQRFNKVIWDYSRSVMILEPGPEVDAPFPERRSFGATLLSDGPDFKIFRITAVGAGTPAAAAGLLSGDIISKVDATPAKDLTLGKLRQILSEEGSHHVLAIARKSDTLEIPITVQLAPISGIR